MAASTDDTPFCPPPRDAAQSGSLDSFLRHSDDSAPELGADVASGAAGFEEDSFDWASIEKVVRASEYAGANDVFHRLRSTVLSLSPEHLDAVPAHRTLMAWEFLLGFAVEKNMFRSQIAQVVKRLMQVPHWASEFKTTPKLAKGARMLHEDLQMAFGVKPEVIRPVKSVSSVFDKDHCCTCNACAKPWAFKCKYKIPHYCMRHYREAQMANPTAKESDPLGLSSWAECAPAGFDSEPMDQDSHVRIRSTLPPQTRKLVAKATSKGSNLKEMSKYGLAMSPEKVNKGVVEKASQVVQQLRLAIRDQRSEDVQKLSSQLRELIPQESSQKSDGFEMMFSEQSLSTQVEILELLDSIADANELKSHDALAKYCDISFLEPDSEEGRLVRSMLVQNLGPDIDISAMETFRVSRHEEEDREEHWAHIHPSNNRVLLWHGSQTSRFVSILRNGLVAKEMTKQQWLKAPGGTFDHGIYFTDIVSKSLQYTGGSDDEVLVILAEVCLGSMYACKGRFGVCFDWNARTNAQRLGCHSTWGVGKWWPDPDSAIMGKPDSIIPGCDVPVGEPVSVRCSDGTQPVLDYNEFIVYKSEQVRLRYLIRLKCSRLNTEVGRKSLVGGNVPRSTPMGPRILMPAIRESILEIPYCRFAKEAASMKLESSVRWQYFFDKKKALDSTLPGWHSYGENEARLIEKDYANGSSRTRIKSGGYEYDIDLQRMRQTNLSTQTTRPVRRQQVSFRRVEVLGGGKWELVLDVAKGESVEWVYEMACEDHKIDFRVEFFPSERSEDQPVSECVLKATRSASSWSYTAPNAGSVQLTWRNYFKLASSRVVLVDWHVEPSAEPASSFGGPPVASTASNSLDARSTAAGNSSAVEPADQEAATAKAESREASRSIIREHLQRHMETNPTGSFTSWIAALHPENVTVDPRIANDSEGNDWMRIWREAHGEATAQEA